MDMHGTKEALSFSHKFVSDAISAIINLTFPWFSKLKSEQNSEIHK